MTVRSGSSATATAGVKTGAVPALLTPQRSRAGRILRWALAAVAIHGIVLAAIALVSRYAGRSIAADNVVQWLPAFRPVRLSIPITQLSWISLPMPAISRLWDLAIGPLWIGLLFLLLRNKDGLRKPSSLGGTLIGTLLAVVMAGAGLYVSFRGSSTMTFITDFSVASVIGIAFGLGLLATVVSAVFLRNEGERGKRDEWVLWTMILGYAGTAGALVGLAYGIPAAGICVAGTLAGALAAPCVIFAGGWLLTSLLKAAFGRLTARP